MLSIVNTWIKVKVESFNNLSVGKSYEDKCNKC